MSFRSHRSLTLFHPLHIMPVGRRFLLPFHTVMTSFSKTSLAKTWDKVRVEFSHAFSTTSGAEVFTTEDLALLERVADAVVKRGMTAPATVFLESLGPMNFLGSQALYFLTPIVEWAFNAREVDQVARMLERRDTIVRLIAIIDTKSASQASPQAPQGASAQ
jgi:hypothetical protein